MGIRTTGGDEANFHLQAKENIDVVLVADVESLGSTGWTAQANKPVCETFLSAHVCCPSGDCSQYMARFARDYTLGGLLPFTGLPDFHLIILVYYPSHTEPGARRSISIVTERVPYTVSGIYVSPLQQISSCPQSYLTRSPHLSTTIGYHSTIDHSTIDCRNSGPRYDTNHLKDS